MFYFLLDCIKNLKFTNIIDYCIDGRYLTNLFNSIKPTKTIHETK